MVSSVKTVEYRSVQRQNIDNPILKGDFKRNISSKVGIAFKLNNFLCSMLVVSIVVSMVSYSMVAAKETQVSSVHSDTNELNFENIELQNRVDHARSFYNINNKIAKVDFLKKPDNVIEVKADIPLPSLKKEKEEIKVQPISGY